jgi:DNA-binding GntR family transcriptional regulator
MPRAAAATPARSAKLTGGRSAQAAKVSTATTGEQIAKQLGQDILQGRYAPGQRVGEQAVAEMFALSRGPVRDALRILERQGLVEIRPRRGAYVVELALNDVADIFNVRCALLGLAVRYLARNPDKSALAEVDPRLDQLRKLAAQKKPSLLDFAQATGRVAMGLLAACASAKVIQTTYRDLPHDALWRMLWVTPQPPDYVRPARRADTFHDYEQLLVAIRAGRADAAEVLMRKIMTDTRDEVLGYMAQSHSDSVDPFRQQVY